MARGLAVELEEEVAALRNDPKRPMLHLYRNRSNGEFVIMKENRQMDGQAFELKQQCPSSAVKQQCPSSAVLPLRQFHVRKIVAIMLGKADRDTTDGEIRRVISDGEVRGAILESCRLSEV